MKHVRDSSKFAQGPADGRVREMPKSDEHNRYTPATRVDGGGLLPGYTGFVPRSREKVQRDDHAVTPCVALASPAALCPPRTCPRRLQSTRSPNPIHSLPDALVSPWSAEVTCSLGGQVGGTHYHSEYAEKQHGRAAGESTEENDAQIARNESLDINLGLNEE